VQQPQRRSALVVVDVLAAVVIGLCVVAAVCATAYGIFAAVTFAPEFSIGTGAVLIIAGALFWVLCRQSDDEDWRIGRGWLK
jgi:chromate transport protein ChrA